MSELTIEQKQALAAPFRLEEHYIRQGASNKGFITWLVYVQRGAIIRRIHDVVGFQLSDRIIDRWFDENAKNYDQKYNVIVRVELNGICHEAIGTDTDYMSAETRAYKRAMTHFEIGLYLYDSPTIQTPNNFYNVETKKVTDWNKQKEGEKLAIKQVAAWLQVEYKNIELRGDSEQGDGNNTETTPKASESTPEMSSDMKNGIIKILTGMHKDRKHASNTLDKLLKSQPEETAQFEILVGDEVEKIVAKVLFYRCYSDFELSPTDVCDALGVDKFSQYTGTAVEAYKVIKNVVDQTNKENPA